MASPFPGMDPYLEQHWGDIHHRMITYASDQLNRILPRELRARVEERVFVEAPQVGGRRIVPDVRILAGTRRKTPKRGTSKGPALAEPLIVLADEEVSQGFIEILDASSGHRIVTVIEILSPANKVTGQGQEKYLQKRQELRDGQVSLVEIDLLRAGKRPLPVPMIKLPAAFRTLYQVWIRRGWEPTRIEVYPLPLRRRLPVIGIPLRQTDADTPLDLQALVDEAYRNGDYGSDIDYSKKPEPPLASADQRWVDGLLSQWRRRSSRPPASRGQRGNGKRKGPS